MKKVFAVTSAILIGIVGLAFSAQKNILGGSGHTDTRLYQWKDIHRQ